jgi:hypothetical protein
MFTTTMVAVLLASASPSGHPFLGEPVPHVVTINSEREALRPELKAKPLTERPTAENAASAQQDVTGLLVIVGLALAVGALLVLVF